MGWQGGKLNLSEVRLFCSHIAHLSYCQPNVFVNLTLTRNLFFFVFSRVFRFLCFFLPLRQRKFDIVVAEQARMGSSPAIKYQTFKVWFVVEFPLFMVGWLPLGPVAPLPFCVYSFTLHLP